MSGPLKPFSLDLQKNFNCAWFNPLSIKKIKMEII